MKMTTPILLSIGYHSMVLPSMTGVEGVLNTLRRAVEVRPCYAHGAKMTYELGDAVRVSVELVDPSVLVLPAEFCAASPDADHRWVGTLHSSPTVRALLPSASRRRSA